MISPTILDAMIAQAEPGGTRPDRAQVRVLIVVRYYLAQHKGLLVLTRPVTDHAPVVVQQDCLPYPESVQHVLAPFDALTVEERQTLLTYYDLARGPASTPQTPAVVAPAAGMVRVPGGAIPRQDGTTATVEAFSIDIQAVTNAAYRRFIEAKGYTTETYWSAEGWRWLQDKGQQQPSYWEDTRLNAPEKPVVGVTWYEAVAYCQWAGKALPTEIQWDKACQLAAEQGGDIRDLGGELLEWTATQHEGQGIGLRGASQATGGTQNGCGARFILLPGIAANFIGFRCQMPAQ